MLAHLPSRPRVAMGALVGAILCSALAIAQSPADMRRAEATATEAKALFKNKVYADAARLFMEAYAISKAPALVFNAARAYQELGKLKRAESLFLMYRGLPDVDASGKKEADERLKEVRAALQDGVGETKAPPAGGAGGQAAASGSASGGSSGSAPAPKPAPAKGRAVMPWAPITVAVAALAGGGFAYWQARSIAGGLDLQAVQTDADLLAYQQDRDAAVTWRNVAIGATGLGAAAAGWATWSLLRRPTASSKQLSAARLQLWPTTNGAVLRASF